MTSPMPSLPPLNPNNNNNQAMNDELVEATISYMNTMPPLPHNQPPTQPPTHNAVSPASRHEGQQHYNHQQRASHHQYQQQYHPYSRPPQSNTPYNQEYGGYEGYYNNNKMSYPMPPRQQHQHQVSPHEGHSPHPQYQSPMPPYHQANNMMMQQRQPPTIIAIATTPKP